MTRDWRSSIKDVRGYVAGGLLSRKYLARDAIILGAVILGLSGFAGYSRFWPLGNEIKPSFTEQVSVAPEIIEVPDNQYEDSALDTKNWKLNQSGWYGFAIRYPSEWSTSVQRKPEAGAKWEYRFQFRKIQPGIERLADSGVDVVVYNVARAGAFSGTDEYPKRKERAGASSIGVECDSLAGRVAGKADYLAEQIYVSPDDSCYEPAHFYTVSRGAYIFNIVPVVAGERGAGSVSEEEIFREMPEYVSMATTFQGIPTVRSKPKPKITAPRPAAVTKRDSMGRMICAKNNDRPTGSRTGEKHLDMECCLDYDEYPNPWCHYSPGKYGKLLK